MSVIETKIICIDCGCEHNEEICPECGTLNPNANVGQRINNAFDDLDYE